MDIIAQEKTVQDLLVSTQTNRQVTRVKNERMAGTVPSYSFSNGNRNFEDVVSSYTQKPENLEIKPMSKEEEFGFFDLIDMVNPLQHIPLVSYVYREITDDEIKPISKIIGGGVFGGPAGAASGLVNAVIEEETGKDVMENAVSFVGLSEDKAQEQKFEYEREIMVYEDLPASLLAFAQTPMPSAENAELVAQENHTEKKNSNYERVRFADDRTAGTIATYS